MRRWLSRIFFYAGIVCELLAAPSGFLTGNYHEKQIIVAGMVCFALSLACRMDIKNDGKSFLPLFAYALFSYYIQRSALILRLTLILLSARTQDRKRVVRVFFYGTGATILFAFMLSLFVPSHPLYMEEFFRRLPERRYCFGFLHPNSFTLFWLRFVIMGLYLYGEKLKLWQAAVLSVLMFIPLYMAASKIGLGIYVVALLLWLYLRLEKNRERGVWLLKLGGGLVMAAELIFTASLILLPYPVEYDSDKPGLWTFLNDLTTGRLRFTKKLLNAESFTLFGSRQFGNVSEIGFIDSMYREGLVFVLLYVLMLIWLWRRLAAQKDMPGQILVFLFTLYAFAESFLVYFNKNGVWLMLIAGLPGMMMPASSREVHHEKNDTA